MEYPNRQDKFRTSLHILFNSSYFVPGSIRTTLLPYTRLLLPTWVSESLIRLSNLLEPSLRPRPKRELVKTKVAVS